MFALQTYEVILLLRALYAEAKISGVHFLHSHETESQENQARFCLRAGHEPLCLTARLEKFRDTRPAFPRVFLLCKVNHDILPRCLA
jgi:hypothetical protein